MFSAPPIAALFRASAVSFVGFLETQEEELSKGTLIGQKKEPFDGKAWPHLTLGRNVSRGSLMNSLSRQTSLARKVNVPSSPLNHHLPFKRYSSRFIYVIRQCLGVCSQLQGKRLVSIFQSFSGEAKAYEQLKEAQKQAEQQRSGQSLRRKNEWEENSEIHLLTSFEFRILSILAYCGGSLLLSPLIALPMSLMALPPLAFAVFHLPPPLRSHGGYFLASLGGAYGFLSGATATALSLGILDVPTCLAAQLGVVLTGYAFNQTFETASPLQAHMLLGLGGIVTAGLLTNLHQVSVVFGVIPFAVMMKAAVKSQHNMRQWWNLDDSAAALKVKNVLCGFCLATALYCGRMFSNYDKSLEQVYDYQKELHGQEWGKSRSLMDKPYKADLMNVGGSRRWSEL